MMDLKDPQNKAMTFFLLKNIMSLKLITKQYRFRTMTTENNYLIHETHKFIHVGTKNILIPHNLHLVALYLNTHVPLITY